MKEIKIINSESPFYQKKGIGRLTWDNKEVMVHIDGELSFHVFGKDEIEVTGPAAAPAATLLAYNQLQGKEFPITALVTRVRSITERNDMDASVTKRLRELRADGKVNYEYDEANKKYRKL